MAMLSHPMCFSHTKVLVFHIGSLKSAGDLMFPTRVKKFVGNRMLPTGVMKSAGNLAQELLDCMPHGSND